jgi:hypothetical protein
MVNLTAEEKALLEVIRENVNRWKQNILGREA